jgi:hypothetical protein
MVRTVLLRTSLAAAVVASSFAVLSAPARADWLCAGDTCRWVGYDVIEPAFADAWPAPPRASCFWRQGIFGRWKFVCPNR